jgi:hypothetical protein
VLSHHTCAVDIDKELHSVFSEFDPVSSGRLDRATFYKVLQNIEPGEAGLISPHISPPLSLGNSRMQPRDVDQVLHRFGCFDTATGEVHFRHVLSFCTKLIV